MPDLYELLRRTITAEVWAKSPEARECLEIITGFVIEAIRHETKLSVAEIATQDRNGTRSNARNMTQ